MAAHLRPGAVDDLGEDGVRARIGVEPTGEPFNAITLAPGTGMPLNPMVNAGAIAGGRVVAARRHGRRPLDRCWPATAGSPAGRSRSTRRSSRRSAPPAIATGRSGSSCAPRARSTATRTSCVETYFGQCSVAATRSTSRSWRRPSRTAVSTRSPGERALSAAGDPGHPRGHGPCGMYDGAGEWLYTVGLPAKSGVSGGLMVVVPGQLGFATFSPPVDGNGNSVRGDARLPRPRPRSGPPSAAQRRRPAGPDPGDPPSRRDQLQAPPDPGRAHRPRRRRAARPRRRAPGHRCPSSPPTRSRAPSRRRDRPRTASTCSSSTWATSSASTRRRSTCSEASSRSSMATGLEVIVARPASRGDLGGGHRAGDGARRRRHAADRRRSRRCARGRRGTAARRLGRRIASPPCRLRTSRWSTAWMRPVSRHSGRARTCGTSPRARASCRAGTWPTACTSSSADGSACTVDLPGGGRRRLSTLGPGMTFGEAALVDGERRTADVHADTDVVCRRLSTEAFESLVVSHPRVAATVLRNLLGTVGATRGAAHPRGRHPRQLISSRRAPSPGPATARSGAAGPRDSRGRSRPG